MTHSIRPLMLLAGLILSTQATANTMDCGSETIVADLRDAPTQYQVFKACGAPEDTRGNTWIYLKPSGSLYILGFDGLGQLLYIDQRIL